MPPPSARTLTTVPADDDKLPSIWPFADGPVCSATLGKADVSSRTSYLWPSAPKHGEQRVQPVRPQQVRRSAMLRRRQGRERPGRQGQRNGSHRPGLEAQQRPRPGHQGNGQQPEHRAAPRGAGPGTSTTTEARKAASTASSAASMARFAGVSRRSATTRASQLRSGGVIRKAERARNGLDAAPAGGPARPRSSGPTSGSAAAHRPPSRRVRSP